MSSMDDERSSGQRRASRAIAIPDADLDYDSEDIGTEEADSLVRDSTQPIDSGYASPGVGSYVAGNESWRPVPPPQLASSFETRYQPKLRKQPSDQSLPGLPVRGVLGAGQASSSSLPRTASYGSVGGRSDTGSESSREGLPSDVRIPGAPGSMPTVPAAVLQLSRKQRAQRTTPQRELMTPQRASSVAIRDKVARALVQARMLGEAPRELWLIFALKFLSSYAYFSLSLILTLYLTDEFGMSDTAAGWSYGAYGVMSTFFGLICGWFIDYLGVRASLLVGAVIGAISRMVMALTVSPRVAILVLYTFLPFAECLGIPIMTIGIKRYTNARNRTFAFSLFYSMMNVAALCAGPLVDYFRGFFGDGVTFHLTHVGHDVRLTGLRLIILSSAVATAAMCLVVIIGIREVQVDEFGNVSTFTPNRQSPMEQTMAVLREPAFWRLTVFTLLLVGVRLVFRHIDATMPKYLVRQFGPDAPFGLIYAINPFLIIFLVPLVGLATRKVDSFSMILSGSFVSAASPFWLCIKQSYVSVVLFMVTLSLGEAVYSPRVYEYTMEVSAQGQEGLYSSLSTAPLFSVKLLVGGMSGWLLTSFMPAKGPHHGNILWGIIGITSMTSPVLMWLLRDFISPSNDRADATAFSADAPFSEGGTKQGRDDVLVSSARPPTGRSKAIPVRADEFLEYDEEDGDDNGDEDAQLDTSYHGKSPLSLPPLRKSDITKMITAAPSSAPQREHDNK